MGGKKLNTNLPIDKILEELRKQGASTSLLDKILNLVDVRKRTDAARKLGRHIVVIEVRLNFFHQLKLEHDGFSLQYLFDRH